jgi:DNA-binding response OmpR family regulator
MSAQGKTILVVEDDEAIRGSVVAALEGAHYEAMSAGTFRDAKSKLRNQRFDLVLFDLVLGEERADELIVEIRGLKDHPNHATPFLVVSGNLSRESIAVIGSHVQGALVKPFDVANLLESVRKLLG